MADTFTTYYNLTKPQIGGDPDTWGQLLNDNFDTIDTQLHNANTYALPLAGGTVTGATTFQVRPTFNGATPWDTNNRSNPPNCSTANNVTLDWGTHTSGQLGLTIDTSYQGYLWHSGNFNPSSYMPTSGGAFTSPIQVTGAGGPSNPGAFALHARGGYGGGLYLDDTGATNGYGFGIYVSSSGLVIGAGSNNGGSLSQAAYLTNGGVFIAVDFQSTSDEQLKASIRPLRRGLDELKRMPPREFVKYNNAEHVGGGREEVGFIAQEVQQVLPEAVKASADGYLAVSPGQILALLARAILELDGRMALAGI